jgi:MFS family permease
LRYLVLASLCLAATIAYIPRNCIGVAEADIRASLGLSKDAMSVVMSSFFISYALLQIPSGWLAHVWGARRSLTLFAAGWSVASGLSALAGLPLLLLARLGMGGAQAGLFPCSTSCVARWLPARRWALANGLLGSFMQIGGVVAVILTGLLLEPLGWQWLFVLYAVPGFAWAAWFFLWFRDRPEDHPGVNAAELALIRGVPSVSSLTPPVGVGVSSLMIRVGVDELEGAEPSEPTPWRALFTSWAMVCICGQQFFRAGGFMFFTSWFTTFLRETRHVSTPEAGFLTSLPIGTYVLGSSVGGLVSDWVLARTGSRRLARQGVSIVSQLGCALLIVWAYFIYNPWLAVLVIAAGSFCSAFAGAAAYTITIDMGGKHVAPVFSTMNMAGNIGAAVFPYLVPPLVDVTGSWNLVLFLFAGMYLGAALFWMPFDSEGTIFDRPGAADTSPKRQRGD